MPSQLPYGATEFYEGLEEDLDIEQGIFTACRQFDVPWSNRFLFIAQFFPSVLGFATDENLISAPKVYPDFPSAIAYRYTLGKTLLTPDALGGEEEFEVPIDTGTETVEARLISYQKARIKIFYKSDSIGFTASSSNTEQAKLRFEVNIDSEIEFLEISGQNVKNDFNKKLGNKTFNITSPIYNFQIHYPEIKNPGFSSILNNAGHINISETFLILNDGTIVASFPQGTLRYDGPSASTRVNFIGNSDRQLGWDITHRFSYNKHRWNRIIKNVYYDPNIVSEEDDNIEYENARLFKYTKDNFAFVPNFTTV